MSIFSVSISSLGNVFYDGFMMICSWLVALLLNAINVLENIFRGLAGLPNSNATSTTIGVGDSTGNFIIDTLQGDAVRNLMLSLTFFALAVLVLMVILAIIRNVYKEDSKVTVSSIVGQALKAAIGFILVPAVCLVGVIFSNVLLEAIDGATNTNAVNKSFGYGVFSSAKDTNVEDVNPFEYYSDPNNTETASNLAVDDADFGMVSMAIYCQYLQYKLLPVMFYKQSSYAIEGVSGAIDTAEEIGYFYSKISGAYTANFPDWQLNDRDQPVQVKLQIVYWTGFWATYTHYFENYDSSTNTDGYHYYWNGTDISDKYYVMYKAAHWVIDTFDYYSEQFEDLTLRWNYPDAGSEAKQNEFINKNAQSLAGRCTLTVKRTDNFYNNKNINKVFYFAKNINYFYALLGCFLVLKALFNICFGMAKRIVQIIIYYILSPIALAMYPWDNGAAFGKWRSDFVGYTIGAYAAIAGMNLTVQLISPITNLTIFKSASLNGLTKLILYIVLAQGVGTLIGTISSWIGGKDLFSEGKSTKDAVAAPIKAVAGAAVTGIAAGVTGGAMLAKSGVRHIQAEKLGKSRFDDAKKAGKLGDLAESLGLEKTASEEEVFEASTRQAHDAVSRASKGTYKAMFGNIGSSMSGMLGKATGVDVVKTFQDTGKKIRPDSAKIAEKTGVDVMGGKWFDGKESVAKAINLSSGTGAAKGLASVTAGTGAEVLSQMQTSAEKQVQEFDKSIKDLGDLLVSKLGNTTASKDKAEQIIKMVTNGEKVDLSTLGLGSKQADAAQEYILNVQGLQKQRDITESFNSGSAFTAIQDVLSKMDPDKLAQLSTKGTGEVIQYAMKEIQGELSKQDIKSTPEMISAIERVIAKQLKGSQPFKTKD